MNQDRRRAAATATVGLGGVAGAGALRHRALMDAYDERTDKPIQRPRLGAERRLLKVRRGRGKYLAGAGLALVTGPAAIKGTSDFMSKRQSFVAEGVTGVGESLRERRRNLKEKPPAKLVAANYGTGAAVGSLAGGAAHLGLRKVKLPGGAKAGLASSAGVLAGAASLPAQRRYIERKSRGRYTATSSGITRRQPVKKAIKVIVHGPRPVPKAPRGWSSLGAGVGLHQPTYGAYRSEVEEAYRRANFKNSAGRRRKLGDDELRAAVESTRKEPRFPHRPRVSKADADPGASLSRNKRRALVTATGGAPVIGDFAQAAQAARLAPKPYRRRTAVQQYAGNQVGAIGGGIAGTAGALALANRSQGFNRRAQRASDTIDRTKNKVRSAAHLPPAGEKGLATRALESSRTPQTARRVARASAASRAGRAIARNPKVAAVGFAAGSALGGQATGQLTYTRLMNRDDRYRRANRNATHGTRVTKADPKPMSRRETKQLARRKEHGAVMSAIGGATGIGALTALGASKLHPKLRRLKGAQTPLLTVGAGIGGINAFNFANVQHKEAKQQLAKAFGVPRAPRVPSMRRGFLRQTRTATGIKVSSVRGGLQR